MLALSLTMLLAAWTATAVRYAISIRNAEPMIGGLALVEREPERLAA